MAAQRGVRRWLVYGICLAPAIAMLAYYTLEYVPGQREYFMQLRFRSLSDINDHARTKFDSLLSALNKAPKTSVTEAEKYVHALVPDLRYLPKNCVPPPKLSIELGPGADTVLFRPLSGCAASASLSHVLAPLVRDDLFDDVVIADAESGLVIYQRSGGAPRVASVKELLKAPSDPKAAGAGSGAATDSDAVRYMQLDGRNTLCSCSQCVRPRSMSPRNGFWSAGSCGPPASGRRSVTYRPFTSC